MPPDEQPDYKVYRSRRKGFLRGEGADLERLRERLRGREERGPRWPRKPGERGPITPGRVLRWVGIFVVGWVLLSAALFVLSAQLEEGVSAEAEAALSDGGSFFTGATTLVLGSDQRKACLLYTSPSPRD